MALRVADMVASTQTVEGRLTRLETTMEHLATKTDVANLRAEMLTMKSELIRWMIGLMLASATLAAAVATALG